ncbi:hypothetical protein G0U57_005308 [Chelydra serpentina]|uniref:Uncharacterized protein n=1 Tax=Chelydra serpentina TaxID=8475 RepID=A0A8T1RYW9_CHESE|nr:hypothetical protein G0U57_005308 [Chelydra serpentina]
MVAAVVSFFLGWLPYLLYHGLKLYKKEVPESVTGALLGIYTFTSCFNASFSPHPLPLRGGEVRAGLQDVSSHFGQSGFCGRSRQQCPRD